MMVAKKFVRISSVFLLLGIFILGSAFGWAKEIKTKEITFMHLWGAPTEKKIIGEVIDLFEKENPNIKVKQLVFESSTYHTKILQLLLGKNPPDVFMAYPGFKTYDLVDRHLLLPLNSMWKANDLDQYFPVGIKSTVTYKRKQWNLPWVAYINVVLYNKHLFKQLGLADPTTFEELEDAAAKIKKAGYYPFVSGWKALYRAAYPIDLILPSIGGPELFTNLAALRRDWNNQAVKQTLAIWKNWVTKEYWYPDARSRSWQEGVSLFLENKCAMDMIGSYVFNILDTAGLKYGTDYDFFFFPQINKKYPLTLTGPFDSFAIPAKAAHLKEAQKFLAFLATNAAQSIGAKAGGMVFNKNVDVYTGPMQKIKTIFKSEATTTFRPGFFEATTPLGLQMISFKAMPDFYDNPDIAKFIKQANDTRKQYQKEKR
jgi:ABC-type glycerol-3-phosphate transport system substrate-binding protein